MKNRGRKVAILGWAGGAIFLWMGCAGGLADKQGQGDTCTDDTDCRLGFCDRGSCTEIVAADWQTGLGAACASIAPALTGEPGQQDANCRGFLCMQGRCRSCVTDGECQNYFGAGKCRAGACELPSDTARYRDGGWTGGLPCANVGPNVPVDQRLQAGNRCLRDCDCRSGFCDRGTCAEIGDWHYGEGWCMPGRPTSQVDYQGSPGIPCLGYLCIDQRCRSCMSDAECQLVDRPKYRCLSLYGLPGKMCGYPAEVTFGPANGRSLDEMPYVPEYLRH